MERTERQDRGTGNRQFLEFYQETLFMYSQ